MVSQYGANADTRHHICTGGKWIGICNLLQTHPELLNEYEYFWFPDDDIETSPEDISQFLKLAQNEGFKLAQPSLTPQSVYAYRLTISNPRFNFRRTNFVELMMPLIHRDLLLQLLPIMSDKHAALGVDWVWHTWVSSPMKQVAIVDSVQMGHYRPRNKHLVSQMKKRAIDLVQERENTVKELNVKPYQQRAHEGELVQGERVKGARLKLQVVLGYFSIRHEVTQQRWGLKQYLTFIRTEK